MKRYSIFHVAFGDNFKHVATLDTTNLDQVFCKTNTITHVWWDNEEIIETDFHGREGARSLSVGDIILDHEAKELHLVDHFGFKKLSKLDDIQIIDEDGRHASRKLYQVTGKFGYENPSHHLLELIVGAA